MRYRPIPYVSVSMYYSKQMMKRNLIRGALRTARTMEWEAAMVAQRKVRSG